MDTRAYFDLFVFVNDQVIYWMPGLTFLNLVQLGGTLLLAEGIPFQNLNVSKSWVTQSIPSIIESLYKEKRLTLPT